MSGASMAGFLELFGAAWSDSAGISHDFRDVGGLGICMIVAIEFLTYFAVDACLPYE